ncbi:hypothetical protein RSAG8_09575, partial [Rhizoctonia solani AG-8 WAC10335]
MIVAHCHRKRRSSGLITPTTRDDSTTINWKSSRIISAMIDSHETSLIPPQLPPFLANVFNLKPILGNPNREEVKLVHEAVRALNNFLHTPELRDTDLPIELSQHLFDIQMGKNFSDIVYDPPALPSYIPVELKPVTGPPSNTEVASVHAALRISESFANLPSIFDPDLHVQLSQHLFDIQLARHVQRSIMKRSVPAILMPEDQAVPHGGPGETEANNTPETQASPSATPGQAIKSTETQHPALEQSSLPNEATNYQISSDNNEKVRATELMIQIRDKLENVTRILVGTQNSLARGFNSSSIQGHLDYKGISHNLGAHSLINDHGEVPEAYSLPTFTLTNSGFYGCVEFSVNNLTENILARYLRFYGIGEEMIEEGEELKIKSGMLDEARSLLSGRLFLNRR